MTLSPRDKKDLKAKAHQLNPVVIVGTKGLTDNVHNEIDRALNDHELIKVKIAIPDRIERKAVAEEVCAKHSSALIQLIGNIAVLYRKRED